MVAWKKKCKKNAIITEIYSVMYAIAWWLTRKVIIIITMDTKEPVVIILGNYTWVVLINLNSSA